MEELLPLVCAELRRVARRQLRNERGDHILGASGLINEAYLKLERLSAAGERLRRIVEYRFFRGLAQKETGRRLRYPESLGGK